MKNYDVKYDIGQEVYTISERKIIKTVIDKIEVIECLPYKEINRRGEVEDMSGINIRYLVMDEEKGNARYYRWYNQDDVSLDPSEFIKNIQ